MRDKERREVDFLVVERRKPFLLVEAKLSDTQPSAALAYFKSQMRVPHAVQIVRNDTGRRASRGATVMPAERLLGVM